MRRSHKGDAEPFAHRHEVQAARAGGRVRDRMRRQHRILERRRIVDVGCGRAGLVGDAELVLQLPRRHAVGMRRHEMRGPEPCRQRQLGAMHRRARDDRSLTFASKAFVCVRAALQCRCATLATAGTDKTVGPTPLQQESRATRLVGKRLLKLR